MVKLNFYWNFICCGIGCIGLLVTALCYYLSGNSYNDSEMLKEFESMQFKFSAIALIVASCPVLLDVLVDCLTHKLSENEKYCLFARLFIAVFTAWIGLQFAFQRDFLGLFESYELCVLFNEWCLRFIWTSSVLSCLSALKPSVFTIKQTCIATSSLTFLGLLRFSSQVCDVQLLAFISFSMVKIWLVLFIIYNIWCGYKLLLNRSHWTVDDYSCLLYCGLLFFTHGFSVFVILYSYLCLSIAPDVTIYAHIYFNYFNAVSSIMISII